MLWRMRAGHSRDEDRHHVHLSYPELSRHPERSEGSRYRLPRAWDPSLRSGWQRDSGRRQRDSGWRRCCHRDGTRTYKNG